MKRAEILRFVSFAIKDKTCVFNYEIDKEVYSISLTHSVASTLNKKTKQIVLFNIGMCYLVDLAITSNPELVEINFPMRGSQISFWKKVYQDMGKEMIYLNQLDISLLNNIWRAKRGSFGDVFRLPKKRKQGILCLSGGKESLTLLKIFEKKLDLILFFHYPYFSIHRKKVYKKLSTNFFSVKTDSNCLLLYQELSKYWKRAGWGVSGIVHLVFNTLLFGDKCEYVLIGNEYSSNFPNTIYQGQVINHQQCKTVQHAIEINDYLHQFVTPDYSYFSPFFGFYEYKIASWFFKNKKYLNLWTSCNQVENQPDSPAFCSACYKCAFIYLLSLVYIDQKTLGRYFSHNMLEDLALYKRLMDFSSIKPFDCVGDKKEVWVALAKVMESLEQRNTKTIKYFKKQIYPHIKNNLKLYEFELNSQQTVPQRLPSEIQIQMNQLSEAVLKTHLGS